MVITWLQPAGKTYTRILEELVLERRKSGTSRGRFAERAGALQGRLYWHPSCTLGTLHRLLMD